METASPQALVLRILALLAIVGALAAPAPFVKDTHLVLSDAAVHGNDVTMFATQATMTYRQAVDHDRGQLGWAAAGAVGLIVLVLESMAYQRAIKARRRASGAAAIARFVPIAIAGGAAAFFGYPRGGAEVEPYLGLLVVAAATAILVAMTLAEMSACRRGERGWTAPPPLAGD
jgi:hypothetical protein